MGLMDIGSNNPYAIINPFAAVIDQGMKGWRTTSDRIAAEQKDVAAQAQQDQILEFARQDAERKNAAEVTRLQKLAEEAAAKRAYEARTIPQYGFQQGPTEPMQAPMNGLMSAQGSMNPFVDPRLAAMQGPKEAPVPQPVANMGAAPQPPMTQQDMLNFRAQYAGTPTAEAVGQNALLMNKDELANAKYKHEMEKIGLQNSAKWEQLQASLLQRQTEAEMRAADRAAALAARLNRSGSGNGLPAGVRLKQGERYNPSTDTVEAIPGSDLYITQSKKHGKDLSALNGINLTADNANKTIDYILDPKNSSAFNNHFGGYNALLTQYSPFSTDMGTKLESLKSNLKKAGLDVMRSGGSVGQMTEKEWPIVEQMIASIKPTMSENEARSTITNIKNYLNRIKNNANEVYQGEWSNTPYYNKRTSSGVVRSKDPLGIL